jgi:aspartate/methionine/tyrosine aminotransferase
VDYLAKFLRERYELSVVPGRFFEMPDHLRVGVGGDTSSVRAALEQLSKGLDAYRASLPVPSAEVAQKG